MLGPSANPANTPNASIMAASAPAERGVGNLTGAGRLWGACRALGRDAGRRSGPTRVPQLRQ
jgi:hypothetical protein